MKDDLLVQDDNGLSDMEGKLQQVPLTAVVQNTDSVLRLRGT